jgi:hypothetical protein
MDASELEDAKSLNDRPTGETRSSVDKGAYTGWQLFFLVRLESLLRNEEEYANASTTEETVAERNVKTKLLHKAIYSTYGDCIDQQVGPAAKRMLKLRKRATGTGATKNN